MSTLNVLRYSALALGVVAGFKTDLSLKSEAQKQEEQNQLDAQLKLVEQAKAEYAKLHPKKEIKAAAGSSAKIDLEDPNLDYASVILSAVESLKQ
ncbi:Tim11 [Kluyveromyces lactis]|nr:Tim11 [Kluyveromyces lactis]